MQFAAPSIGGVELFFCAREFLLSVSLREHGR
jgi:hypothetical protein